MRPSLPSCLHARARCAQALYVYSRGASGWSLEATRAPRPRARAAHTPPHAMAQSAARLSCPLLCIHPHHIHMPHATCHMTCT
eukprot:2042234-Prymnesium_polylepis.1